MKLGPGEPPAGPWRVTPISDVVHLVFDVDRKHHDRPWIVAVEGEVLKQVVVNSQTARFDAGLLPAGKRLTMSYKPLGGDREPTPLRFQTTET